MEEHSDGFIVYAQTKGRTSPCPHCGKPSKSVHDHRYRKLQSTEFLGRNVQLVLRIRHFRCRNPECACHTFSEPLKMAGPYSRMSYEVAERVRYESLNQSARLACESLSRQHIHVSKSTCIRRAKAFGNKNPERIVTSGYVGIDEISRETGLCPTKIYRPQKIRLDKLLNKDQKACLRHAGELARHISSKCITPGTLVKKMDGKLKSSLVCRCVRELVKKY